MCLLVWYQLLKNSKKMNFDSFPRCMGICLRGFLEKWNRPPSSRPQSVKAAQESDNNQHLCECTSCLSLHLCMYACVCTCINMRAWPPPQTRFKPVFNHLPNGWGPASGGNGVHSNVKHVKVITAERSSDRLIERRFLHSLPIQMYLHGPPRFTPTVFI